MQVSPAFPTLDVGVRRATLKADGRRLASFRVKRLNELTRAAAEHVSADRSPNDEPLLVSFRTASPEARALLHERRVSYAGDDGEWFLLAPPVYVERPAQRSATVAPPSVASPFALRASRIPRWLLLRRDEFPSLAELARAVELSEATVSRTAWALADDGLAELSVDPADARVRRLRARDSRGLLEKLEQSASMRRTQRLTWDVGARDTADALARWRDAADALGAPYAVGGVAGASMLRRVVEPADLLVWIDRADIGAWAERLVADPARRAPGRVTVHVAPDPFVLTLASQHDGIRLADAVQLYLDCRRAGERALEATDAIRELMRW